VINKVNKFLKYPLLSNENFNTIERIIIKLKHFPIKCSVCGNFSYISISRKVKVTYNNIREIFTCKKCGSTNRQRQLAYIICNAFQKTYSLNRFFKYNNLRVHNTESQRSIHNQLFRNKNYTSSEYFGDSYISGQKIKGKIHQNLMNTSFKDEAIDLVISSDVFEHIPEPYTAHKEIYRVLKRGGKHIFNIPFNQTGYNDIVLAKNLKNNKIKHFKKPRYHSDPISTSGCLVYTNFSIEMICKLKKIGFNTKIFLLRLPLNGILGCNAVVFESTKE